MLKNYLKVAVRNLRRHPGYSLINVVGLAIGLACCLLIGLYVQDELSYDHHHEKAERIFRVTALYPSMDRHWGPIGPPVGPALASSVPEIEKAARIFDNSPITLRYEDRQFEEQNAVYADSTVFEVFTLPLVQGDARTALAEPGSIVLTQAMARKYFGREDPMGRSLSIPGRGALTVTGVLQDPPRTTHLPMDFLISLSTFYANEGDWVDQAKTWAGFYTYVLLRAPHRADAVEARLPVFVDDFFADRFEERPREVLTLKLQLLTSIHLHSNLEKEYRANGNVVYVYVFSVIALFILVIACINFINLATARSVKRMREVGVRKALGAQRMQLAGQFLGESLLLTLLALVVAIQLVALGLPVLNHLAGKALTPDALWQPTVLLGLGGITLLVGLLAGLYPALYVSGFLPTRALRGGSDSVGRPATLRKALIVFQFAISIFLVIGTGVVLNQLHYVRTKQLGFDKERVVNVELGLQMLDLVRENPQSVKQELLRHPAIAHVAFTSDVPGERFSLEQITVDGRQMNAPGDDGVQMRIAMGVDHDYLRALGVNVVAGRHFSERAPADTNAWIVNESAVRQLGLEDPVGTVLRWGDYAGPVVGVAENFHFASLHREIEPLVLPLHPTRIGSMVVRVEEGQMADALAFLRGQFDRFVPDQLFHYSFLGEDFSRLYQAEDKLSEVFGYFSAIAILIACLGLFGLTALSAEQRTKEIGIRKVLGASVASIFALFSKDFLKLVIAAFIIAAPVAYFAMQRWLEGFAYQIELGPWIFLGAGVLVLIIALLTVSYQAIKAALMDPVKSLRYE